MSQDLLVKGLFYYEKYKNNKQDEINSLEFRTWLATSIDWLEKRVSKSELYKVIEAIKIYSVKPTEISFNQIEMYVALLQAQTEIAKQELENMKNITSLNF